MDRLTEMRSAQQHDDRHPDRDTTIRTLRLTTAYTSLVTGGTLFAFSTFVMPGLRQLPAPTAVAAMQAINAQAPRSLLLVPLLGSAAGGASLVVVVLTRPTTPSRGLLLLGGLTAVPPW